MECLDRWLRKSRGLGRHLKDAVATRWIDWTHSSGGASLPGGAVAVATGLISILWTFYVVDAPRRPPRYFVPLITCVLFALILLARRLLGTRWPAATRESSSPRVAAGMALPLIVLALGLMLTRHGQTLWPLSAVALVILTLMTWNHSGWWQRIATIRRWIHAVRTSLRVDQEPSDMTTVLDARPSGHPRIAAESAHGLHPIHWMQRTIDSHGTEHLKGVTQVEFQSGQSFLTAHIPFCPPFAHTPVFECHPVSGEEIRVRTSVAYPYGARIELKRQGSSLGTQSVEIEFAAVSAPVRSRAA
jgi:hypothetical protein